MITLEINGVEFKYFNHANVCWRFDSVASTFAFELLFDPNNANHRRIFKPGAYAHVVIKHKGNPIITGVLLKPRFKSSSVKHLVSIAGYSTTGVLEDCSIPQSVYPLQINGLSFRQIAEKIVQPFGLKVTIDPTASKELIENINKKYTKVIAQDDESCNSFLKKLACQRQIVVSHDVNGNLLLTESKTNGNPIHHFESSADATEYELDFNGQRMHSELLVQKQATKSNSNAGMATLKNPYVNAFRPTSRRQSSGDNVNDTKSAVRNVLSEELKAIELTIRMRGWELNNTRIAPNTIITVKNPELYLFEKTKFFVESINFRGSADNHTSELKCFIPETYNNSTSIKNIFES